MQPLGLEKQLLRTVQVPPNRLSLRNCCRDLFEALSVVLAVNLIVRIVLLKLAQNQLVKVLFYLRQGTERRRANGDEQSTRQFPDTNGGIWRISAADINRFVNSLC